MPVEYYNFGTVACQLPDHQNADLGCSLDGNVLLMSGLPVALPPSGTSSYQRIKVLNVYNPFRDGFTGLFFLESLKPGVNTILEFYGIPGTLITPGQVFNPLFNGYPSNLNQYVDYSITFTPMNHLNDDSLMQVIFPSQFGALATSCRIVKGLSDKSSTEPLTCTVSGKTLTISNFARFRA